MIKAITFDFWNTLYKIPADKCLSSIRIKDFGAILRQAGLEFSPEDLRVAFKTSWQHAWYQQRAYGLDITPRGHVKGILEKLEIPMTTELEKAAYEAYTRALQELPPVVNDGVRETLPLLADKYRMAVICNTGATPGVILRELVKKDGLDDYFAFMVFSDEVGFAKPSVEIFDYTLKKLGIVNSAAAHIGDDAITDVIGAKKAGMKAVWLAPDEDWAVPEADYHIWNVNELLKLF
ncbi:MAG: HAD family hydrolase [Syntrophomonadaceae bacterium]|nr:HAD family hydrolase [Syntrophomonadaceae bacterium]MDD3023165.1 HAD family hydrolase [Syntrophomonadaceae bacterium]